MLDTTNARWQMDAGRLFSMGAIYYNLGATDKAEDYFRQALTIYQSDSKEWQHQIAEVEYSLFLSQP